MLEETETEIKPTPSGTTVTTTATVDPPVLQDTFDRIPVEITFLHNGEKSWSRSYNKGKRARLLLGLWEKYGPFQPIEGGIPDEIITAGRKAQAAYWYALKSDSISDAADAISVQKATISIYSSQIRWTLS